MLLVCRSYNPKIKRCWKSNFWVYRRNNKRPNIYDELLAVFITSHDPTTLNKQGADYGTQYRSVIYYHNTYQKTVAEEVIAIINPIFNNKIITEISPLGDFYPAEAYHQNYYNQNNSAGYCNAVITPKVNKLRKMYADKLKENA